MLELIIFPYIWLIFLITGVLIKGKSYRFRSYVLIAISIILVFSYSGYSTSILFLFLSLFGSFGAYVIKKYHRRPIDKLILVFFLFLIILVIICFLKYKIYFQKYFLFLPSLSYLGFRCIDLFISTYRSGESDFHSSVLQISFFPTLVMGPITRVANFKSKPYYNYEDVINRLFLGLLFLIFGNLSKNFVIMDDFKMYSSLELLNSLIMNSFFIYFIFAGYSSMIIGLGLLVGIKVPENFNNPYFSTSITDFWRKWHMSLSFWIRDYIYIPLGGNRLGLLRKSLNILISMVICGIWHGVTFNFLIWGIYHGFLLAIEGVMREYKISPLSNLPNYIYKPLKNIITFILVTIGWFIFTYDIESIIIYLRYLF